MRAWDLNLTLDPAGGLPVFLQIARAISNEVRRHRLRPGGTYVSRSFPDANPRSFAPTAPRLNVPARAGFDLRPSLHGEESPPIPRGTLNLASGVPDPRLLPAAALSRAYRRALRYRADAVRHARACGHRRFPGGDPRQPDGF